MTIPSVANSATDTTNNGTACSADLVVSAATGRVIIAFAGFFDASDQTQYVSSVVFDPGGANELSLTQETSVSNDWSTNRHHMSVWYGVLPDGVSDGTYAVESTFTAQTNRAALHAWEVNDANTSDPIGGKGTGTGSTATITVDVTSTATNSLIAGGGGHYATSNFTPGTGDTEVEDVSLQFFSSWSGYTPASTVATYTVSASPSSSNVWAMVGVEILEAGGGPAGRTTKNTDSNPLGIHTGMAWRINQP